MINPAVTNSDVPDDLDVAVNEPGAMCRVQCVRRLAENPARLGHREASLALEETGEALSFDERHREVGETVRLAYRVDGQNMLLTPRARVHKERPGFTGRHGSL